MGSPPKRCGWAVFEPFGRGAALKSSPTARRGMYLSNPVCRCDDLADRINQSQGNSLRTYPIISL